MKYLTTGLADIPWITHGFFSRLGGGSGGLYGSLNCAWSTKADDPAHVRANRKCVAGAMGIEAENLLTLDQRHTSDAVRVTAAWTRENLPIADALVTAAAGFGMGVLTADCVPVLFASKKDKIVGAAHAGWKGAITGVLEAAVGEMEALGAKVSDIAAAIGPCIGPQSYEVSEDFSKPFLAQGSEHARFFMPAARPGHLMFNLSGYVMHRLTAAGIETVYDTQQDTLPQEDVYFSYRRSCLRGESDYGRQISIISIK